MATSSGLNRDRRWRLVTRILLLLLLLLGQYVSQSVIDGSVRLGGIDGNAYTRLGRASVVAIFERQECPYSFTPLRGNGRPNFVARGPRKPVKLVEERA